MLMQPTRPSLPEEIQSPFPETGHATAGAPSSPALCPRQVPPSHPGAPSDDFAPFQGGATLPRPPGEGSAQALPAWLAADQAMGAPPPPPLPSPIPESATGEKATINARWAASLLPGCCESSSVRLAGPARSLLRSRSVARQPRRGKRRSGQGNFTPGKRATVNPRGGGEGVSAVNPRVAWAAPRVRSCAAVLGAGKRLGPLPSLALPNGGGCAPRRSLCHCRRSSPRDAPKRSNGNGASSTSCGRVRTASAGHRAARVVGVAAAGLGSERKAEGAGRKEERTMSAVWLQIGQCGNQLGQEWWQISTSTKSKEDGMYPFYSHDGKLSVVCVDSEPKVVKKLQKQIKRGAFRESNLIVGKQGRGNNWAYGYHGVRPEGEQNLFNQTMESLRKEVERRDCYCGAVLFHSLSGGTGAGLSSRLCEAIREEYPLGHILSVSVVPHQAGESPLQHYNALLCLSWLQRYADGILLFRNDEALKQTSALQGKDVPDSPSQVSFSVMNTYIACCLAGLLHPLKAFRTRSGVSLGMEPWELLRSVCPMPAFKFLHTAQSSMRGTVSWDSLASSVTQSLPRRSPSGPPHQSMALLAVARSPWEDSFLESHNSVMKKLKQAYRCVPWNPFPATSWTDPSYLLGPGHQSHSLTVCANHSSSADLLQKVEQRARAMYESRAFLHWYWRHGCEEGDFQQGFEVLRSIIEDYHHLGD